MVHIWHEDSKDSSTSQFWYFISRSNICPEISNANIVGFGGNDRLTDAVEQERFNPRDIYIIIIDNSKILPYFVRVKKIADKYTKDTKEFYTELLYSR